MPLFKKRKKLQKPDVKVYMPYKKTPNKPLRSKKKSFFIIKKLYKSRTRKIPIKLSSLFFCIIIPLVSIALLYIATLFIINMRGRGNVEEYEKEYVIGLENIPVFPGSEFIFTDSIDTVSVANFISSGNSAYRIPLRNSIEDVFPYYEEILPEYGWTFAIFVDVGSEEMKEGQYWVKDSDGLRIYSKFNDIWYELISAEEALSGLRSRVEREVERDLLLANQELQELLPDYPWYIEIPKEYIITYRVSNFENLRSVEFRKLGTEEKLLITPVGYVNNDPLDNFLMDYVNLLNENSDVSWGINNTTLAYTKYSDALRGTINGNGETHETLVLPNSYDKVVYILDYNIVGDSFFEYVMTHLKPQGMNEEDDD